MSNRSNRFSQARQPLAPRPVLGRLVRRVLRRQHRSAVGDFSAALADRPLDVTLRRLVRRVLKPLQTRHGQ